MTHVGEIARKRYTFTAQNIAAVGHALGDNNPAHHDAAFAQATRFGGIIAAAGHSTGVFVSVLAEHFTREHEAYGLEFSYKLKKAVPAGLNAIMEWRVTGIEPSAKLGGDIVRLEGDVSDDEGRVYIKAHGSLLLIRKTAVA